MIYLSGCKVRHRHPRLGFLMTPDRGDSVPTDTWVAADNACFANPKAYTDQRYFKFLQKMPIERTLFATAPDVLGDHKATVGRSLPVLREICLMGFKAAFVAQDGWQEHDTPWDDFDVIFIGGSTKFKFRDGRKAVVAARRRGKRVHMGRVNSLDRLRASVSIGCDSADGNLLKFGPDVNWPRVKYWLDHITDKPELNLENHI